MLTNPSDTLVVDTAKLHVWLQDGDYDYSRELVPSQKSVMEWITEQVDGLFRSIFGSELYQSYGNTLWIVIGVVVLLVVFIFGIYRYTGMFGRVRLLDKMEYEVTEDTIYGINFAEEVKRAEAIGDFRETLRLMYLQTLKSLSDYHLIDWQAFKTPTQYTYEYHDINFRKMTNLFIRVRYGKFDATAAMVSEMRSYQQCVDNLLLMSNGEGGGQ